MLHVRRLVPDGIKLLRSHQRAVCQLQVLYQANNDCKFQKRLAHVTLIHKSIVRCVHTSKQLSSSNRLFDGKSDLSRFLIEIGTDPKEARYWLKNFVSSSDPSDIFMIINLQNDVLENHALLETFASSLSFLHRNGISPLIVLDNRSEQPFKAMKNMAIWNAVKLSDMLEQHGSYTRVLYPGSGVLQGNSVEAGECGSNITIQSDLIHRSLLTNHLPIVVSFGETPHGQLFPVQPWELTVQMSRLFQPKKVMLVNSHGGFLDKHGKVIANINLPLDLHMASQKPWCSHEILDTMVKVNKLLIDLPSESSVVITSADTMLRELFSHRGSGTFFRATEAIHKYTSLKGIDLDQMKVLLNRSFLVEVLDTYFDDIADVIHAIYVSETYSGVAIVLKCEELGVPYMCKFAVTNKAQGQGTGELLWDVLIQNEPSLFWRSKTVNPINTWYFRKCQGSWHNPLWTVFWYGIQDPNKSSGLIANAIGHKDSFKPRGIANIVNDDEEERIGG